MLKGPGGAPSMGIPAGAMMYGKTVVGVGPLKIVSASQGNLVLTFAVAWQSPIQGVKVSGKVVNAAKEWTPLLHRTVRLTSSIPGGPTVEAPLNPDYSFVFESVPAGAYRASVTGLPEGGSVFPMVNAVRDDVPDVTIDLRNNPFPELPGTSYFAVFDSSIQVTLVGVLVQTITQISPPSPVLYFRVDVKGEQPGVVTPWAVTLTTKTPPATLTDTLKLTVGTTVNVAGVATRDGTKRISVDNVGRITGRINGKTIPNLSRP